MAFEDYERPAFATDCVLLSLAPYNENVVAPVKAIQVRLVKRTAQPDEGKWALPGVFVGYDEPLEDALRRAVKDKAGYDDFFFKQFLAYDTPGRDERWRVVSTSYIGIVSADDVDDALPTECESRWFEIDYEHGFLFSDEEALCFQDLAFDHGTILDDAISHLQDIAGFTDVIFHFLSHTFTIKELADAVTSLYGRSIGNEKRKYKAFMEEVEKPVDADEKKPAHRPPALYTYCPPPPKDRKPRQLNMSPNAKVMSWKKRRSCMNPQK